MILEKRFKKDGILKICKNTVLVTLAGAFFIPFNVFSKTFTVKNNYAEQIPEPVYSELPDTIAVGAPLTHPTEVVSEDLYVDGDKVLIQPVDTINVVLDEEPEWVARKVEFSPDPVKAVWLSALFPGLGQVYNRRYWKLPIIAGGYLGLAYATSWNNGMLSDYTKAYADIMDNDPTTKSYMDLFPPSVDESSLDKAWLQSTLLSRKNYYRRNRDLCIICMVGVYLLAVVDAYVDASLSHFDISPDLSMDVVPTVLQDGRSRFPSVGLQWAINF